MEGGVDSSSHTIILPLGAIIQEFNCLISDDHNQKRKQNLVLNFPTADLYQQLNVPYFGETIGRVANRISGAKLTKLNGREYELPANDGPRHVCLHGGIHGWGKKFWDGPHQAVTREGREVKEYCLESKDGDEGFPGTVRARVRYSDVYERGAHGELVSVLDIEYEAELVGDEVKETVVALTNHSYFNLSGLPTIEDTRAILSTNLHLPVNKDLVPLGNLIPHPEVVANKEFVLGAEEPDIDRCFICNDSPGSVPSDTRTQELRLLASFFHPDSRIHLEVLSTEPAFQFYTGGYIDVPAITGPGGEEIVPARLPRAGFCVEPGRYLNAVNVDAWRNMVILKKGEFYGSRIVYRTWQSAPEKI